MVGAGRAVVVGMVVCWGLAVARADERREFSDAATEAVKAAPCDCQSCCEAARDFSKAAAASHKTLFFENDFSYLCDPNYCGCLPGDCLKGLRPKPCVTLDIGGQYRMRFHNERNMRGLGLTGVDDRFLLHRTRLYTDLKVADSFRVYAEYLDAVSFYEDFNPRPIEENRSDLLNLFVDVKLLENCCGELWGRVGRQELLYGDERLISPLDWANTRRTFQGAKLFWRGRDWDIDGFWVRPVFPDTRRFDRQDESQEFMGLYATYKGRRNQTWDFYYLRLAEYDNRPAADLPQIDYSTFGARWKGSRGNWRWDTEAAYQFGETDDEDHRAGSFTVGLGYEFRCACWKPTAWVYYDWASGDEVRNNGFHHQFPLAHKYLGFMDLFGRRNIEDLNFLVTAQPCKKVKLLAWYHIFHLQDGDDVPYNVAMLPSAAAPGGSQDLGRELDLLMTINLTPRSKLLLGYSHFWAGDFYGTNATVPFDGDADFYYTQWHVNF